MAEAYKGLTIRIGADMSNLNKALRSSNAAISETQRQLRQLERLSKLDPESVSLYAQKMGVLNERAQALTSRLMTLKGSNFMGQLATDTEDAALKAKLANAEYAKVDSRIAELKTEIVKASGAGDEAEETFKRVFAEMQQGSAKAKEELRRLGASEEQVAEYAALVERHFEALSNKKLTAQTADVAKFKTQLAAAEAEARAVYEEMARLKTTHPAVTQTEEFERLRREMARGKVASDELRAELRTLDGALKIDPSNVDAARLKMENMQEQVRENVAQLGRLNEQMELLRAKGLDKVSSEFKDMKAATAAAQAEVAELSQKLDKAKARLLELGADTGIDKQSAQFREAQAEVAEYAARLRSAEAALEKMAGAQAYRGLAAQHAALSSETRKLVADMRDAGNTSLVMRGSLQQLGWAMYSTVTPAVTMFAYAAVGSAEEVDAAYRDMRKTVQGTEEQFEQMRQGAIDFSRTHVTSADQMLEIEAMGGQLGVATEKLEAFAETVSNIEIATNLDADTAAEQLGQLSSILKDMSQNDFDNFGDALVRLGNNNAALEDKIMDVMLRISSMGTIVGFTTPQLLAWATSVAATGQGAEAAGTAISNTMSDIETAVGKGGEALTAFAEVAQMSSEDFAAAWESDPSSAMHAFINGLKAIEANGGSADATLGQLGINSVRQKQTIMGLMNTIDGLNANLEMSGDAWNGVGDQWGAAGDAAREAERKAEGFSGAIAILKNNAQAFAVEAGDSIAPAVTALGDALSALTSAYSKMPAGMKNAINGILLVGAALGPVLVMTNAVSTSFKDLVRGLSAKGSAWAATVKGAESTAAALVDVDGAGKRTAKSWDEMTGKQKAATVGLGALKGALATVATGAVIAGVSHIVAEFAELAEEQERARKASNELRSSLAYTGEAAQKTGDAASSAALSMSELTDKTIETIDSIRKRNKESAAEISLFKEQTSALYEYKDATSLTGEQMAELSIAIAAVNDECGTSYEVVSDAAGGYKIMADGAEVAKDEVLKLADAQVALARAEVAAANYKEIYLGHQEAVETLAEATEAYRAEMEDLNDALWNGGMSQDVYNEAVEEAKNKLAAAQSAVSNYANTLSFAEEQMKLQTAAASGAATAAQKFVAETPMLIAGVEQSGQSLLGFCDALGQTGIDLSALAALTPTELSVIGAAYDGTIESVVAAMAGMSGDVGEYGRQAIRNWRDGMSAETQGAINQAMLTTGMTEAEFYASAAEVGAYGEEAVRLYAKALAEGKDPAASSAAIVVSAAEGKLGEFDTKSIGENFSSGFARGISSGTSAVATAARNLALNAIKAANRAQESHSPAKKLIEVGGWFSEGYAIGIGREADRASKEAARMVSKSVEAARGAIGADGISAQVLAAGRVAALAGSASSPRSVTSTDNSISTSNYYITANIEAHDLEGLNAVEEFISLLERGM